MKYCVGARIRVGISRPISPFQLLSQSHLSIQHVFEWQVRQLQQQLAEEVNKGNALRDQLEKMDNVKDFEEALIQERKKSHVLTQRMHELETFISDLLVQQEEEEAKLEGTEKSRELLEAQLQHMLLQVLTRAALDLE